MNLSHIGPAPLRFIPWMAAVLALSCSDIRGGQRFDVSPAVPDVQDSTDAPIETTDAREEGGDDLAGTDGCSTCVLDAPDAPAPGEFRYPCTDNGQCHSGFCLESTEGRVCSMFCTTEACPTNWTCRTFSIGGQPQYICVPLLLNLCDPCIKASDCAGELALDPALCINHGAAGKFCGTSCAGTVHCPTGYDCKDTPDDLGGTLPQCVPADGAECQCSPRAISLSLVTECFVANSAGVCRGTRKCLGAGLTQCDAQTPRVEECNGVDDNCDGGTDEPLGGRFPCSRSNGFGICTGLGDCIGGGVANCDAKVPQAESCNGMDDNCDGQTDEGLCHDGNPCTKDLCDSGSGKCVFEPFSGACDDLDPCTVNDHCNGSGQCIAGSTKNCDDGNSCTDDGCDTGSGSCLHLNNTSPCEDGNPCTVNDSCQSGTCRGGPFRDCADENACTINERCDPSTGSCIADADNGALCDDGNPCTINDICSGGQCIGPKDYCEDQAGTCVPTPPQSSCIAPKCMLVPRANQPSCPCICM